MTSLALELPRSSAIAHGTSDPIAPARHALALMLIIAVPALFAYGLDDRLIDGVSVWSKPLKFQAAIAVHFATLLLLAPLLSSNARQSRLLSRSMLAAAAMAVLEIAYITLQAARGRASHFNIETPIEQALYSLMGVGATIMVVGSAIFGWLVWRSRPASDEQAGLRTGAALGLIIGSILTLVIGGYLGSQASHWIGGDLTDATGMPLTGWSTTGGDLRPAHFLATHMMQVLPVVGLLADRVRAPVAAIWIAAILYTALIAGVAAQGLMGAPLFR